jgi:hypothetical protein
MILRNFFTTLAFLVATSLAVAQNEPCKSYPMNGYTGNCTFGYAISPDGKYFYSSDQNSLKKWDIATNKVIEEIKPFPHMLIGNTPDPRFLLLYVNPNDKKYEQESLFDLKLKTVSPYPEASLLRLLTAERSKPYLKFTKTNSGPDIYFNSDSTYAAIMDGSNTLYQLQIATGKMTLLRACHGTPEYIPELNTFVTYYDKQGMMLVNFVTGKKVPIKPSKGYKPVLTPDKKYVVLAGRGISFIDVETGKEVFTDWEGDRVKFSSDGSTFYTFSITDIRWDEFSIHHSYKYSYPDFKKIKRIDTQWLFKSPDGFAFVADTELFYNFNGGLDFETRAVKIPLSTAYVPTVAEQQAAVDRKEKNIRRGNDALAKLADLKTPSIVHSLNDNIKSLLMAYTDDGRVLIHDEYSPYGGALVILWTFPDGNPIAAYRDQVSTDRGAPSSAVLVPGLISRSYLSPLGKLVGFNTNQGALIYEGSVLKAKLDKKTILALLDGHALLGTADKDGFYYKDLVLVSTADGTLITKVKAKPSGLFEIDTRSVPGQILFPLRDEVGFLDLASPSEVKYIPNAQIPPSSIARYILKGRTVKDRITGKEEIIAGLGPFNLPFSDLSTTRSTYLINSYYNDGFYVYDLSSKKLLNEEPIFGGWEKYEFVTYLKNLNKLFIMSQVPVYTWPKAKDEDPGASAFTVDIGTGEITPYLLTEPRSKYVQMNAASEKAAFAYAALSPCEKMARNFGPGTNLYSSNGAPLSIVLGYDCDKEAYVVARRQLLHPGSNSVVQVSRLFPVTQEELSSQGYVATTNTWQVCPQCQGYPAGFVTEYYSGWSDWEQKSLNIHLYTRKWETKSHQMQVLCTRCKGEAWIRK